MKRTDVSRGPSIGNVNEHDGRTVLARENSASVVLIHVADGWAARNIGPLHLRESEEMHEDLAYIEKVSASLESAGLDAEAVLASGDPADEIVAAAQRED